MGTIRLMGQLRAFPRGPEGTVKEQKIELLL